MNRNVRNRIGRVRAKAEVAPQQSWSPEIIGSLLLILALLSTAGVIG